MNVIISMLQDTSFKNSYFTEILRFVYVTSMTVFVLVGLMFITFAFSQGLGFGILSIILSPLAVLLGIGFVRLGLEALQSVMKSSKYIKEMARKDRVQVKKPEGQLHNQTNTGQNSKSNLYKQTGF